MSHPLEQQLVRLRRKVRRLVWMHGLGWVAAIGLAVALLLGFFDYAAHFNLNLRRVFDDPGIRIICSLTVVAALLWAAYRFLFRGVQAVYRNLDLALRVEGRFPGLRDRLASAVQFLEEAEDDPEAGSPELRRVVISEATALAEEAEFTDVIDTRPARRAVLIALLVVLFVAGAFALRPAAAGIALARLVNPWSGPAWPQEHHLIFRQELTRAASGRPLELAVVDAYGVALPRHVTLYVRYDGSSEDKALTMRASDDAMVYRFDRVLQPFTYWAEGGDDVTMRRNPVRLEVIEPPAVESLSIHLHPPAYTNWPAVESEKRIRALQGTRVVFQGTATKPLKNATLCVGPAEKPDVQVPARISADGYGFAIDPRQGPTFEVTRGGQYWFRLEDTEGIVSDDSAAAYELHAVPDGQPTVLVDSPAQDAEFTATAVVSLIVTAKDDLALRDIVLRFARSDRSELPEVSVPLYAGPAQMPPQPEGLSSNRLGESRTVTHPWTLKDLNLPPGTQLTFYATAGDYKPQGGQSPSRRLRIITPEQLLDRVSEQQRLILSKLAEILQQERTARTQLGGVQIQWKEVGKLEKPDLDRLEATRLTQDRVNDGLTNETSGVMAQVRRLLAYLQDNQVDSPDIQRRMQALLTEIGQLHERQLPNIARSLKDAATAALSKLDTLGKSQKSLDAKLNELITENLASSGTQQEEVIAVLERLLGEMTDWDHYHRFQRDVAALRREHEEVTQESAKVGQDTLTRDPKDLTPQQLSNLKKLSRRQQELARQLDGILQRMDRMKGQLQEENPLAAGVLDDALHHARSQGLSGQMRQATGQLERNQVGQAGVQQKKADEGLQELQSILANRKAESLSRLVKQLKEAERHLENLLNQQKGLQKKMQAAAANPNEAERRRELKRLAEEQRRLQEETERFARKLRRLQAEQAAAAAASAAGQMSKSGGASEKGQGGEAEKSAQQALEDLQEAQQQLADARRQAELDLAMEQLAKIEDALTGLKNRQQTLLGETQRLEESRLKQGQFTRGQKESLRSLAREAVQLRQETSELATKLEPAAVFHAALKGAARELELAGDLLANLDAGEVTQRAEANALRRFEQLLESLKPEPAPKKKPGDKGGGGGGGQGGNNAQAPTDGIPNLAQLKMLKLMQMEVLQRTKELDARVGSKTPGELTEAERREASNLSQQQGEVARLLLNLSRPTEPDPAEAPEALPDFSPDGKTPDGKTVDDKDRKRDNPKERGGTKDAPPKREPIESPPPKEDMP